MKQGHVFLKTAEADSTVCDSAAGCILCTGADRQLCDNGI